MNKKKYIAFPILLSLLCINNVYADCTQQARDEFKTIEDQYKITTEYNRETKTYTMRIEEGKPEKFRYVFSMEYDYRNFKKINENVAEITGLKPGMSFDVTIMGQMANCRDSVRVDYVKLKRNNEYYGDPLCKGIEEFALCQEFYEREINRETFEKRIESYKESKIEKQQIEEQKNSKEKNTLKEISTYLKENLIQVIIVVIFIILIIVTIITTIIREKKSRRLE